jgi:DNA invertase Pin-like site-specific DNA recombinase
MTDKLPEKKIALIRELRDAKVSAKQIAYVVGVHLCTVRKYAPPANPKSRSGVKRPVDVSHIVQAVEARYAQV